MDRINRALPRLEQIEPAEQMSRQNVAAVLRDSPAMRTLAEVVRDDEQMFGAVADFMARRAEFRAEYDRPGRTVAPWFAAVSRENPDLLEVALDSHFTTESQRFNETLISDTRRRGFHYAPQLVIGSGPQAQIYVSSALQEQPQLGCGITVVDKATTVGGTFRSSEGMNFRLNSRTRSQTDAAPAPGTSANLNTLVPGVVALSDMVTETYVPADTFGRAVRLNHALNGSSFGLGHELIAIVPDLDQAGTALPGKMTAVLRDPAGKDHSVRTDVLVGTLGNGEQNLTRFQKDTQALIRQSHEDFQAGEETTILSYPDFYELMSRERFPLKGIKRVAVIGDGDGGRTAIGTLLGYEPRADGSVLQVDTVEEVVWFGQRATNDEDFVRENRFRYAQLGLELPRASNSDRASRITPRPSIVEGIQLNDDGTAILGSDTDSRYDMVIVATGGINDGENWLMDKIKQPMRVDDERVQAGLGESPTVLEVGDTIIFPRDCNVAQIQVLAIEDGPNRNQRGYKLCAITNDGETSIAVIDTKDLGVYCDLNNFQPEVDTVVPETAEALTSPAVEVLQTKDYLDLSPEEQIKFLRKNPIFFPGTNCVGLASSYVYKASLLDDGQLELGRFDFNRVSRQIVLSNPIYVSLEQWNDSVRTSDRQGLLMVNSAFTNNLESPLNTVTTLDCAVVADKLEELADKNAVLLFDKDGKSGLSVVALYRNDEGQIKAGFRYSKGDAWESAVGLDGGSIKSNIELSNGLVIVITPNEVVASSETGALTVSDRNYTSAEFKLLNDAEKLACLKPSRTIILTVGRNNQARAFLVTRVVDDDTIVTMPLDRDSSGTLKVRGVDEDRFALGGLRVLMNNDAAAIINTPGFFDDAENDSEVEQVLDNLSTEEIRTRVNEFVRQGAVFVDTTGRSFLSPVIGLPQPDGKEIPFFARRDGFIGSAFPDPRAKSMQELAFEDNYWNRVIIPKKRPAIAEQVKQPISLAPTQFRLPGKPQVVNVMGEDNRPIAKKVQDVPIFLAGPAAGLRVSSELVRLIPNIPENSAGVFASQPNTNQLAGRIAVSKRVSISQSDLRRRAFTDSTALDEVGLIGKDQLKAPQGSDVFTGILPAPKLQAARRLDPQTLLRFGLGTELRRIGLFDDVADEAKAGLRTISFSVSKDRFDGEDMLFASAVARKRNNAVLPSDDLLMDLLSNPTINYALATMLRGKNTEAVNLTLPVDGRGLRVDGVEITTKKKLGRRPLTPTDAALL